MLHYDLLAINSHLPGRLIQQTFSDTRDVAITDFTRTLKDLKQSFDSAVNIQTAFISFRVSHGVEKIGLHFFPLQLAPQY
jgi:hypothetical protein